MNIKKQNVVGYLVFNRVRVEHANTISSPITYGFPAITAFLGASHAMSRKLAKIETESNISLGGVLIACHDCEPQVYRTSSYSDYTFNQTRNPIKKDGKTASIIEEGKCHLTVSLVVEVLADDELFDDEIELLPKLTQQWIQQQRMAGGSVCSLAKFNPVSFVALESIESIKAVIMPAFVLMDAKKDLQEMTENLQKTNSELSALDALIDVCTLHHIPEQDEKGNTEWNVESAKTGRGWLVPIPVGYQGISEKFETGIMLNTRNPEYPSQYVEAIYSLGKWVFPYRIENLKTAFWHYSHDADQSLLLTTQNNF
jgi:CRISPR-associated protein Csy2